MGEEGRAQDGGSDLLATLVQLSPAGLFRMDLAGRCTYVSAGWSRITGMPAEQALGDGWVRCFHPDDLPRVWENWQRAVAARGPFEADARLLRPDGTLVIVNGSAVPERGGPAAEVVGYVGAISDITRRTETESALRDSEARFRSVAEAASDGMVVVDTRQRVLFWNGAAERMFGFAADEVLGRVIHEVVAPDREPLQDGPIPEGVRQLWARRKDGSQFPVELTLSRFRVKDDWNVVAIVRDVGEQRRANVELRRRDRQLERALARAHQLALKADAANRAKSDFLASMSHEIRTPLNGMLGMQALALEADLPPDARAQVEVAQDCAQQLLAIIEEILDFSKIEAGRLELEQADFELRTVTRQAVEPIANGAARKGLALKVSVDPALPEWLHGDGTRLRQVLLNLLGNALKFTAEGGIALRLSLVQAGGDARLQVEVEDTGIGIDPSKIGTIFEPFRQADALTTRHYGGTGLGLSICRRLVEAMGGEIGVRSEPGSGSTFWLTVPLIPASAAAAAGAAASVAPSDEARPARVLVVEDNLANQAVLRGLLKSLGHVCEVVSGGREALQRLASDAYDLVLLDIEMPEMSGEEVLHAVRAGGPGIAQPGVPIVMLTAHALRSVRDRCLADGANEFLTKPIRKQDLAQAIARWAGRIAMPRLAPEASRAEPAGALDDGAPFDYAGALERLGGEATVLDLVIEAFVAESPRYLVEIAAALEDGNGEVARRVAHALKGAAAAAGARVMQGLARTAEDAAGAGDLDAVRELVPRLSLEFERFQGAVRTVPA